MPRSALLVATALTSAVLGLRVYRATHPWCDGAATLRRFSGGGGVFRTGFNFSSTSSSTEKPRVVVTGANSGVGFESARLLALGGARVILGCRSASRCQAAADAIDADVTMACADWRESAGFGDYGGGGDGGHMTGPHGECAGGAFVGVPLDLGDLASVERFAQAVLRGALSEGQDGMGDVRAGAADSSGGAVPLRALVLNAGIFPSALGPVALPRGGGASKLAGLESAFAVNHLGHFHLANLLMPALEAAAGGGDGGGGGRVVIVSSEEGHRIFSQLGDPAELPLPAASGPGGAQKGWWWGGFKAYGLAKLANVLHAQELARRLGRSGSSVTANALHPGFVPTRIGRPTRAGDGAASAGSSASFWSSWSDALADGFWLLASPLTKSLPEGAATTLAVTLDPALASVSGAYFDDCAPREPAARTLGAAGAAAGARLWALSERLVQEDRAARAAASQ